MFIKWLTIIAYLGAAGLCAVRAIRVAKRENVSARRAEQAFWWGNGVILFFLGLNKQFQFLSALTRIGRAAAWNGNWFQLRQGLQLDVIAAIFSAVVALLFLGLALGGVFRHNGFVLGAVAFLIGFNLIRVVSLHAIDVLLYRPYGLIQLNWVFELGGIALVAFPVAVSLRKNKTSALTMLRGKPLPD